MNKSKENDQNMQKILVPTDFSECSANANEFAVAMAKKLNSRLIFFHAYHFPVTDPATPIYGTTGTIIPSAELMDEHERNIKNNLMNLCSDFKSRYGDEVACDFISEPGFFVDKVLEQAEEQQIDLIIMGTRGASGIKEKFFGSNTSAVIEKANCPVLAVPDEADYKDFNKLIFATDLEPSDAEALSKIVYLLQHFDLEVIVLHVIKEEDEKEQLKLQKFEQLLNKNVKYNNISFKITIHDDPAEGIEKVLNEINADVVAMAKRKKSFLENLFNKSVTNKLAYHSEKPLLAYNKKFIK